MCLLYLFLIITLDTKGCVGNKKMTNKKLKVVWIPQFTTCWIVVLVVQSLLARYSQLMRL